MEGEKLIRECRRGNARAQRTLFEGKATLLFRLCCRYVREQAEAEDILLRGFQKIFESLDGFEYRNEAGLTAWMKRIMVNECLMFLRKTSNFHLITVSEDLPVAADTDLEADLHAEAIYALILELPAGYRTVFNLYVLEGYSHQEIAAQLQIGEMTSRSQLSKAKALLREKLTPKPIHYAVG